jgi:thiol-disulfide isomerase/thioredoxin
MRTLACGFVFAAMLALRSVSAAADPDADWKAIQQVIVAGQPLPGMRGDFGAMFDQRDRLARDLQPLLEAFYGAHPQDPRRWRAVQLMTQHAPTFIARRGPNFATKGMLDVELDTAAKSAHEAKVTRYETAMEQAGDVPREVLFSVRSRRLGNALRAAKEQPQQADLAALRAQYEAFAAKHPGTPFVLSFANIFMSVVEAADPGRVVGEWSAFTQSADERVRNLAREKVRAAGVLSTVAVLSFTAVDGRAVDLAQLRGKVVLIDFWATWCGPCVAELPNVKRVYAAYREKGFEVIGIALENAQLKPDDTPEQTAAKLAKAKKVLTDFAAKNAVPWPQHFDGKFWKNEISTKYAISSIPAMFLVDQEGNVVSMNARGELLEKEVKRLLKL